MGVLTRVSHFVGSFIFAKIYHDELDKNRVHIGSVRIGNKAYDIGTTMTIGELESLRSDINNLIDSHKESITVEEIVKNSNEVQK